MVKQTAPLKRPSSNGIAAASPVTTSTRSLERRARSDSASRASTSMAVSRGTRERSTSVVRPGPGPISSTSSPSSTP